MIVRTLAEITGGERDVSGPGWRSRRIVLRDDGKSFLLVVVERKRSVGPNATILNNPV